MKRVYIGVDVGTSGCKAAAIGGDGGICGIESVRYDDSLACSGPGCYDQPAAVLRGAAFGCIRALTRGLPAGCRVDAIGLTGQMHGLVALDERLRPLRPIISCVDFRNEKQNSEIYRRAGGVEGLRPVRRERACGCVKMSRSCFPGCGIL